MRTRFFTTELKKNRPRIRFWSGVLLFILLFSVICGCGGGEYDRLTVIHTNDIHGHILPERVLGWPTRTGGYGVFAAWVKEVRGQNESEGVVTLLVDAGDIFAGTVEGNVTRGRAVITLMNALGYDAMTLGNHEFDFGYYNLEQLAANADFPFLGANVFRRSSGEILPFLRPYIIREISGRKVALIGVTTAETPEIILPGNIDKVLFRDPVAVVRTYLKILKDEGADVMIVLSHLGLENDRKLAEETEGIDLIIGGHSHDLLEKPIRAGPAETIICQAGSYGRYAGRIDLRIDRESGKIAGFNYRIFRNRQFGDYAPDIPISDLLSAIRDKLGDQYDRRVGMALDDIPAARDLPESPLGNLITEAVRRTAGTEAAFQNAYGIRYSLLKGEITRRDIFKILPFDDTVHTMVLSGRQIRELLEQSLTGRKGMLRMSGIAARFDPSRPEGDRLISAEIKGEPLREEKDYSVAANGFLAAGGDYFRTFQEGKSRRDTGILLREALSSFISDHTPLYRRDYLRPRRWREE